MQILNSQTKNPRSADLNQALINFGFILNRSYVFAYRLLSADIFLFTFLYCILFWKNVNAIIFNTTFSFFQVQVVTPSFFIFQLPVLYYLVNLKVERSFL